MKRFSARNLKVDSPDDLVAVAFWVEGAIAAKKRASTTKSMRTVIRSTDC